MTGDSHTQFSWIASYFCLTHFPHAAENKGSTTLTALSLMRLDTHQQKDHYRCSTPEPEQNPHTQEAACQS